MKMLLVKVDPRACGVNEDGKERTSALRGRSPRMRGKRWRELATDKSPGSIPAHAG